MFGLFKKTEKPLIPLEYERRKYFENNILWLEQEFPEPSIEKRKIFVPTQNDFPIQWNNSEKCAYEATKIIAENMMIDYSSIDIAFFDNGLQEINSGLSPIFLKHEPHSEIASGYYHHKNIHGKYEISLERELLKRPDALIATIAHELSHILLLGEKKLDFNDEDLTDLSTVFFGFGIFNANTVFQFYNNLNSWGYRSQGYLTIYEWAYTLALYTFIRGEDTPEWRKYLNISIKKEFDKSLKYMLDNESEIFNFNEG